MGTVTWILFDAVGTLMHADPPVAEAYHAAGQRHGSRLPVEAIGPRFRQALAVWNARPRHDTSQVGERERWRELICDIFDDVPDAGGALFESLWEHFGNPRHWRLYDDVARALAELARRGFRLGIASNFDQRLRAIVASHPPLADCQALFISAELGYMKPDLRFFRAIESQLATAPASLLLVGDDLVNDHQGALAAGWQSMLLDREGELSNPAIRSLTDLLQLIHDH